MIIVFPCFLSMYDVCRHCLFFPWICIFAFPVFIWIFMDVLSIGKVWLALWFCDLRMVDGVRAMGFLGGNGT